MSSKVRTCLTTGKGYRNACYYSFALAMSAKGQVAHPPHVLCAVRAAWTYEPVVGLDFKGIMDVLPGPHVVAAETEENPSQAFVDNLIEVLLADLPRRTVIFLVCLHEHMVTRGVICYHLALLLSPRKRALDGGGLGCLVDPPSTNLPWRIFPDFQTPDAPHAN
jgi:hypothetical protein